MEARRTPQLDAARLRNLVRGEVIEPGDPGYDEARQVHNASYDRRPAVIVRAVDAADVVQVVTAARETGLELAIRSGGHSVAGHSMVDGGIVLDMSAMRALHIDPDRRVAWAQPGLTAGEYTAATAAHGLATGFGDTGSVGLGGLTLGGGIGWLVRKHGLTIDDLLSVELVTADGRLIRADATHHPDLFWAVRGGGGNFGVVTRFEYRLHPVDVVVGGALFLPPTPEVLAGLVRAADAAPDELSMIAFLVAAPPLPFVPVEQHGKLTVIAMLVYAGDVEAGQEAIAPFRALAEPIADVVGPMPYPAIYQLTAEGERRAPAAIRSLFMDSLDEAAAAAILDRMATPSSPFAATQIRVLGGAVARVPADATAFAHRDARVMVSAIVPFEDPGSAPIHEQWATDLMAQLQPASTGVYVNFVADEGDDRIREAYPAATYQRLAAVKRRYDPTNLFHLNQNVRPLSVAAREAGSLA